MKYLFVFLLCFASCSEDIETSIKRKNSDEQINSNEITKNPNQGLCKIESQFDVTNKFGDDSEKLISQIIYNKNGKEIERRSSDKENNYYMVGKRSYDKNGNNNKYDTNIETNGFKVQFKGSIKFDKFGNQIERNTYDYDGTLTLKTTYEYDNKGNQIKENHYNSDGNLSSFYTYKYDSKGNQIEQNNYNSNGNLDSKSTNEYDSEGNRIEQNYFNSSGSLDTKWIYKYDNNGNVIEENNYSSDGTLERTLLYKYNDNGDKIESIDWDKDEISKTISKYEYCSCSEVNIKKIKVEFGLQKESTQSNRLNSSSSSNSNLTHSKPEVQEKKCYSCEGTGKCVKCGQPQRVKFRGKYGFETSKEVRLGKVVCSTCYGDGDKAFGNSDNYGVIDEPCHINSCNSGWIQCEKCSKFNPGACRKCEGKGYILQKNY